MLNNYNVAWLLGTIIILAIIIYPLYKSFKLIQNESPIIWFLVFLLIPGQIDTWVILIILNSLLKKGVLNDHWILGSPILVSLWTVIVALTFFCTRKNIYELIKK